MIYFSILLTFQTQRVPSQVRNITAGSKTKDINLFSENGSGGPTLIKKPEKLRAGSPVQMDTAHPPRHLPSLERPPPYQSQATYRPPWPTGSSAASVAGSHDISKDKYVILNREFDGRAIDPGKLKINPSM